MNRYNKGKFRSGEWAKHLRPYLKRVGNKRFRKTGKYLDAELEEFRHRKRKLGNRRNRIKVRFTLRYSHSGELYSYTSSYRDLKSAQMAMRRSQVIRATILNDE